MKIFLLISFFTWLVILEPGIFFEAVKEQGNFCMGFDVVPSPVLEVPPWVYVTLSGYSVGDDWSPADHLPHNGTYKVYLQQGGYGYIYRYVDYAEDLYISFELLFDGFVIFEVRTMADNHYYSGIYISYPWVFANDSNNLTPLGTAYWGGGIVVWWPFDSDPWGLAQVCRFFNIPLNEGIMFEPFWYPGRKMIYRFADTRDNSRIKLLIDKTSWTDETVFPP